MTTATRRLGQYRLVKQLAVGGMAEIYLATVGGVEGFEKQLALKVIHPNFSSDPEFIRMLVDEAKLCVQLDHPNIVKTFDLGRVGETHYISMEMVDGPDLFKVLRRAADVDAYLTFEMAAHVAAEVAEGLDYAHHKKDARGRPLEIVHRDVSPQNVLISYTGEVKLCDFGIAKAARSDRRTAAGVLKGKYYYMAPEQAWGEKVDARADIFSTGILLYEMLVGQMLYLEEDLERLLELVRRADIVPPSTRRPGGVPRELDEIVMRALRKRPAERYQTAAEMAHALSAWVRQAAPDFTPARLGGFIASLVEEEQAAPTTKMRGAREVTAAVVSARASSHGQVGLDFTDEHSLIFRMNEDLPADPVAYRGVGFGDGDAVDDESNTDRERRAASQNGNTDFANAEQTVVDNDSSRLLAPPAPVPMARPAMAPPLSSAPPPPSRAPLPRIADDLDPDGPTRQMRPATPSLPPQPVGPPPRDSGPKIPRPPMLAGFGTDERTAVDRPLAPANVGFSDASAKLRPTDSTRPGFSDELPPEYTPPTQPKPLPGMRTGPPRSTANNPTPISVPALPLLPRPAAMEPVVPVEFGVPQATQPGSARVMLPLLRTPWPWLGLVAGIVLVTVLVLYFALRAPRPRLSAPLPIPVAAPPIAVTPLLGTLHIETTPPGADIYVNGKFEGRSPVDVADLPLDRGVTVELRRANYRTDRRTLSWPEGGERQLSLAVTLDKARR